MKTFLLLIGIFLSAVTSAQLPGEKKIDSILNAAVPVTGPSGLIITTNERVVYQNTFGEQPGERVSISSTSKWLAAATLLTLVDDGMLSLDEKIGNYSKQFKGEMANITLRQLLSHTSGLPANSIYVFDTGLNLSKSVMRIVRRTQLITPPGTEFVYGNVSYQLAGHLAEEVSGKDWHTLFREKIATPCGMTQTDFGNQLHINISEGAYSTAEDFSKFLSMLLNKGALNEKRILSEKSIHEMFTNQIAQVKMGYTPYYFKAAMLNDYYGLGAWINRIMIADSSSSEVSARGANGFTGWINFCNKLTGVYTFDTDVILVEPLIRETRFIINLAFEECADMQPEERMVIMDDLADRKVLNVRMKLDKDAMVSLKLFDVLGNEILVIINGFTQAGSYLVPIETTYLSSGTYFYRLEIDGRVETKKIKVKK